MFQTLSFKSSGVDVLWHDAYAGFVQVGGKRSVIVPADLGYGEDGCNEIPPDADYFIMDVEMLDVRGA